MKKIFLFISALILAVTLPGTEQPDYKNPTMDVEKRVEDLLKRMSLDEKIDQLSGNGFSTRENSRLGIPVLKMTDGPVGVRWKNATAFPAAAAIASSWDKKLVFKIGRAIALETRARGRNYLLAPCINIHRFPVGGRNFESYGEDPYLTGQIAVAYIQGVQSENVLACAKHYACNNQEWNRGILNVSVDKRTLHEIYLPAFKAAIREGGVWTVMSSYNKVNGKWSSENHYLLNDVLKKQWGFRGFVVSDWGAVHHTSETIRAGLDLEMPTGKYLNDKMIKKALKKGEISTKMIDEQIRRLLRVRFLAGMFDQHPVADKEILTGEKNKKIAYSAALNGIVLLKNRGGILPIQQDKIKQIAVIGPNAAFSRIGGGGSAKVTPFYSISPLTGLKNKLPKHIRLKYAQGTTIKGDIRIIDERFFSTGFQKSQLKGEYFNNAALSGSPVLSRQDRTVNFLWYYDAPSMDLLWSNDHNYFSVRWSGKIHPPVSGRYTFKVMHNDGARLQINHKMIINQWNKHRKSRINQGEIYLKADEEYDLILEYFNDNGVSEIKLGWEIPGEDMLADAVRIAGESDMAIIFAGLSDHFEGEGRDRNFLILENQDRLIRKVQEVNPKTVVVMITGTPPIIEAWADSVPAIVQAWFGGQEGGNAIADILLGNSNPGGKLPCSFYRKKEDSAGFHDYRDPNLQSVYKERMYVGYRYLDFHHIKPRFPFGHGLSYSRFEYGHPRIIQQEGDNLEIAFSVANHGKMAGSEVAQIYVKPLKVEMEKPEKELKAFKKVFLLPGQQKEINIILGKPAFSYFNTDTEKWEINRGHYDILIGSSSKDIRRMIKAYPVGL